MERRIGARELKTRLGTYLKEVRAGSTIVVTERGEPVAELRPLPASPTDLDVRLQALAARGVVTRGSGKPLLPRKPRRIKGPPLSQTILSGREERP